MGDGRCLGVSVAAEAPGQFDVEGVEVDVADALEQLGGSGSWPGASGSCSRQASYSACRLGPAPFLPPGRQSGAETESAMP